MVPLQHTSAFLDARAAFSDHEMGRAGAPGVNVLHPDFLVASMRWMRSSAPWKPPNLIPLRNLVVHLGERDDMWSPRTIEFALTALEHLGAFARPLGVRLLVENLLSEATTPEHLSLILEMGHLDGVGVRPARPHHRGTLEAITTLGSRIASIHVHDNHGAKDEHLWPGDGTIDWPATVKALKALGNSPATVLEIGSTLPDQAPCVAVQGEGILRTLQVSAIALA